MWRRFSLVAVTAACMASISSLSAALPQWHWRNPYPQGNRLWDVCFGNGTFVAVGDNALLTSTNGEHWVSQRLPFSEVLKGVTFGDGLYVAVGWNGTILTSSNTVDWQPRNSGIYRELNKVVFGAGKFVAVAEGGVAPTILVSIDAINWSPIVTEVPWGHVDVAFGNGTFVGVGESWVRSVDATNWTSHGSFILGSIVFGNGLFVAFGNLGHVYTSMDGATFEARLSGAEQYMSAVGYDAGRFVAVGNLGAVAVSTNGTNWAVGNTGFTEAAEGIAYGNGKWVVVGDYGRIIVSSNATQWTTASYGSDGYFSDVAGDEHLLVAVDGGILTSPNGAVWSRRNPSSIELLYGVCRGAGQFVAVGESGRVVTSADGVVWSGLTASTPEDLHSITFGSGQYVAVGLNGAVITSSNTVDWTPRLSGTQANLFRVIYANGLFLAAGSKGTILSSTNGMQWSIRDSGLAESTTLVGIAWGNGRFVSVGWDSAWLPGYVPMLTSADGLTWINHSSDPYYGEFRDVAFGNGVFVAAGGAWTSSDGIEWTDEGAGKAVFNRIAFINGKFIGVGPSGAIMQSEPINQLQIRAPGLLTLSGPFGLTNRIEVSTNLVDWSQLQTVVNATGVVQSVDLQTNAPRKFYRAVVE